MISVSTKYIREGLWKCNLCNRISFQINRVFHIWYIRRTSCKVGFISIAKWWVAGFSLWSFCWYFILRGLFENRWPTHVWQILFKISCRYSNYENNNTFIEIYSLLLISMNDYLFLDTVNCCWSLVSVFWRHAWLFLATFWK